MAGGLLSAPVRTDSTAAGRLPGTLHAALSAIGVRQEPVPLHRLSLSATARAVAAGGPGTSPGAEPVGPAATTPGVFRQARTGSSGAFRTDAWNVRLEIALASVALVLWIGVIWRQRKLRRLQAELAERAQVEAALRASEERYRLISENSNDVIWLFDLTTNRFAFVSPSIERLRGYTVGEVLRQEPTELMTAESYGMVQELLPRRLQAFAAGDDSVRVQTHEIGQTCRDGSVLLTEVVTTLIAGPERRVTHIQGVSRDISGRKTMEQALRRSEQKFATLFRSSPEAFFLTSVPEGRITEVNDSASRLTGYARDALLGSRATDLGLWVNPAQRDHYTAILRQAGRVVDYEGVMRNARGEERICVVSGETVELEEGPHLLTIVHDVTDARRAEEAMRQRMALQDQLARVATTVPGVICSYRLAPDGAASLPFATTALEDVCGLPPEVVREDIAPLLERVHPEDREPLLASIAESARTMQAWGHTFRMEHPQKGERWLEGHSVPRREADGGILWHGFVQDVTERTQAAEALHRERQRLASIIKAADVGTWEWHVQTGETVFNERWAGMLGYTLAELEPASIDTWVRLAHPDDLERSNHLLKACFRGDTDDYECEARMRHRNGSWVWVLDRGRVTAWSADGKPLLMQGTHLDISARKLLEAEREAALAKYRTLFDSLPVGVTVTDAEGHLVESNTAAAEILGLTAPDQNRRTIGGPEWPSVRPDGTPMPDEERAGARALREQRVIAGVEMGLVKPGGAVAWLSVTAAPLPLAELGVVVTYSDISARKEAQEAIATEAMHRRLLIEGSRDGIVVLDEEGGVFEANRRFADMLGRDPEEVGRMHVWDWDPHWPREKVLESIRRIGADGEVFESRHRRKDGTLFDVELSNSGAVVAGRKLVFCVCHDITERKRTEAALRAGEARLRAYVDQAADAIFVVNAEGRFIDVNQRACLSLGYSREELLRMRVPDVDPGFDEESARANRMRLEPGHHATVPGLHHRKDGSAFPVEVRLGAFNLEGETVFLALARDVTERNRAEARAARLRDLGFTLAAAGDLRAALNHCLETAIEIGEADAGGIYLVDQATGALELKCHHGLSSGFIRQIEHLPADGPHARWAAQGNSYHGSLRDFGLPSGAPEYQEGLKAVSFQPVMDGGRLVAVLNVVSHTLEEAPVAARSAIETVAGLMSGLLQRLQAQAALQQLNRDLEARVQERTADVARSEQRHRELVESIPDWVWEVDAQGRYVFCGPQCRDLLGYEPEEMLGRPPFELLPPGEADRVAALVKPLAERGERLHAVENVNRHKDGRVVILETNAVPVLDAQGRVLGYRGLDHDITERRRAEAQLRMLWSAVSQSPVAVVITDHEAQIEYVNPAFERETGFCAREAIGQNVRILQSGLHDREFYTAMWATLIAGETWLGELCNRRKDGSLYWERAVIAPIRDEAGRTTHYAAISEDITERRRIARELREAKEAADAANRAKSVFLANMSHEIRTPMNAIMGYAQLMLRNDGNRPDARQRLQGILRSGEHLLGIITEILEMARMESGRETLRPVRFRPDALLHDLETMFGLRAASQKITFNIRSGNDLSPALRGDATKLRQILINLLGNAFKFTPAGGSVVLQVGTTPEGGGRVRLHAVVQDTGPGIDPAYTDRIFDPFVQTDSGRAAGGTGLGLAISRQFARLMDGDLVLTPQPGAGARFELEVSLPLENPIEPSEAGGARTISRLPPEAMGYRVLIAEGTPDDREVLGGLLEGIGFSVRTAPNGREAVELCRNWAPELAILDLRAPVIEGCETVRGMRSVHGQRLRILVLGDGIEADQQARVLADGADRFLARPFQETRLLDEIRELTGLSFVTGRSETLPTAADKDKEAETNATFPPLPEDLVRALSEALIAAEYERMLVLADRVAASNAPLSRRLRRLVEAYDYEALEALLKASRSEP